MCHIIQFKYLIVFEWLKVNLDDVPESNENYFRERESMGIDDIQVSENPFSHDNFSYRKNHVL